MTGLIILVIIIVIALLFLTSCIKIVPQAKALVIERLGAYQATWSVGLHFKLPIIERVARRVDLKEQVVDFAPQPVITKDNVTMRIDTVVFYQITDPKMFCYGVANPIMAIENLTATTLRNIIGDLELDQTLTSRETINTKMRASLDVATDPGKECLYNILIMEEKQTILAAGAGASTKFVFAADHIERVENVKDVKLFSVQKVKRNLLSLLQKVKKNL